MVSYFIIIIIINEFHRDTSLKQNFTAADMRSAPTLCLARLQS